METGKPEAPENNIIESASQADKVKEYLKRRKLLFVVIFILLTIATIAAIILIPIFSVKAGQEAIIKIPPNASKEIVKDSLSKYLGEEYAGFVIRAATLRRTDFSNRYGAYLIEKGMSPLYAERRLAVGNQNPIKIVINGFRTPERLSEKIALKLNFTTDSLMQAINNPEILKQYGLDKDQGLALFPDATYEVYWSDSPEQLIARTAQNYKQIWNKERTSKAMELGLTPAEIMIICSIVDEETNKSDEKGDIGRLYINRIKKGMKLQADPTVKYAVGDFSLRRILNKHLKTESPYNTYLHEGLPPGPIRTTGTATIDSVLNSKPSEYLYMCAKADFSGYHAFAESYQEHMQNAKKYQQALNERGIK